MAWLGVIRFAFFPFRYLDWPMGHAHERISGKSQ
jgi:hypothetical protein